MRTRSICCRTRSSAITLVLTTFFLLGAGAPSLLAAQKLQHSGIELEGYATAVTPNSITVFDKKRHETKITTDKDYSSLVGIGAAVTVWYTTEGGERRLEDIEISQRKHSPPQTDSGQTSNASPSGRGRRM